MGLRLWGGPGLVRARKAQVEGDGRGLQQVASSHPSCPYFCSPSLPVPHSPSHQVWDSPSLHSCEPPHPPNTPSFRFPVSEMQQPHHLRRHLPLRPKPLNKPEPTTSAPALNTMASRGPGWDLGSRLKRDLMEPVTTGNIPAPAKFCDPAFMFSQP